MTCKDCGETYGPGLRMVILENWLWEKVNGGKRGCLCAQCIEKRLGRPIELADLQGPVNGIPLANVNYRISRGWMPGAWYEPIFTMPLSDGKVVECNFYYPDGPRYYRDGEYNVKYLKEMCLQYANPKPKLVGFRIREYNKETITIKL